MKGERKTRTHSRPQASQKGILLLLGFQSSSMGISFDFPLLLPAVPTTPDSCSSWTASLAAFLEALISSCEIVR